VVPERGEVRYHLLQSGRVMLHQEPFNILRNKNFRLGSSDNLDHGGIQPTPFPRDSSSFSVYGDVLAWETADNDIHRCRQILYF
jgi:hypothetical protein